MRTSGERHLPCRGAVFASLSIALSVAQAQAAAQADELNLAAGTSSPTAAPVGSTVQEAQASGDPLTAYFSEWNDRVDYARSSQPSWSSPLATTTGLLEQRIRFDAEAEHSGNGTDTTLLDGGKGLDLIVSDTNEIQIAAPGYDIRSGAVSSSGKPKPIASFSGFGDWGFLRVEQRLASGPAGSGDYVLTAWLTAQSPSGIERLTNHAWTYSPTLAFGKGWGAFDIQATMGGVIPASHSATLGQQIQTNIALQYHVLTVLWPELELNETYYPDGQRAGLNQAYVTAGIVAGRFALTNDLKLTLGAGYQTAVSPAYRAKPLTPAFNQGWLFSSRVNF